MGKGKIARYEQFLLFPQLRAISPFPTVFVTLLDPIGQLPAILIKLKIVVSKSFSLEESIICRLGKA